MANDLQDLADWLAHRLAPPQDQTAGQAIANTVTGVAEAILPAQFDWLEGRVASIETMLFGTPQNTTPPVAPPVTVPTPVAPPVTVPTPVAPPVTVPTPPVAPPATDISSFTVDQLAAALAAKQAAPPPGDISTFSVAQLQAALLAAKT